MPVYFVVESIAYSTVWILVYVLVHTVGYIGTLYYKQFRSFFALMLDPDMRAGQIRQAIRPSCREAPVVLVQFQFLDAGFRV